MADCGCLENSSPARDRGFESLFFRMLISFHEAVGRLQTGRVIAIPTDTVFGLAAIPSAETALRTLKRRPDDKPFAILCADWEQVNTLTPLDAVLHAELEQKWPGAFTAVLPRWNGGTVALRIPDHPDILLLLQQVGPLLATSVNKSSEPYCTTVQEIEAVFGADFPILKSHLPQQGVPSTIAAWVDGQWQYLRMGCC